MAGITDVVLVLLVLGGGYYLWSTGELGRLLQSTGIQLPAPPGAPTSVVAPADAKEEDDKAKEGGGDDKAAEGGGGEDAKEPAGGGGEAEPAAADTPPAAATPPAAGGGKAGTGTGCNSLIYTGTGKTVAGQKDGPKTRHYASGKPDDTSTEWNAKHNFKNFEFTWIGTVSKVDHDDTVSLKFGGTHMGSGWYDCGISFNAGQGCLGKEENHPSTDLCVVKCKSMGKIVGKKMGIKAVYFGNSGGGGQIELWGDPTGTGTGWIQLCARTNNVGGFAPSAASQESAVRIDGAPGLTGDCAITAEITGPTKAAGGGASPGVPPTQPVQPASGGGQSPQSGGGEPADTAKEEKPAAKDDKKKSEYGRVNRAYMSRSRRVRYY